MQPNLRALLKSLILLEATRFKKETGKDLPRWQERLAVYEKAGGHFVHFSTVPRMGLFTKNKYGTPIGFYVYPLNRKEMRDFAVERPYALVIKPKPEARLLNLASYKSPDLKRDSKTLIQLGYPQPVVRAATSWAVSSGMKLWSLTRILSGAHRADKFIEDVGVDDDGLPEKGGGPTGKWTMLLKRLGYDGVVDPGLGIIHPNEPSQAIFFDTTKVELVDVIEKSTNVTTATSLFSPNFDNRDLRKMSFDGVDLAGASFFAAKLEGVRLSGHNLSHASFDAAKMRGANLEKANLSHAFLERADLRETSFEGANLTEARFARAWLEGANFRRAKLRKAVFGRVSFDGVDLSMADCRETSFLESDLREVRWKGAKLEGATYNKWTRLPEGFDPDAAGMKRVP